MAKKDGRSSPSYLEGIRINRAKAFLRPLEEEEGKGFGAGAGSKSLPQCNIQINVLDYKFYHPQPSEDSGNGDEPIWRAGAWGWF